MWLTLLESAIPFFTAGGGGALAWYMRGAMGKNRDPKPTPKVPTLAEAVKGGYEAVEKMATDIHRMYHPEGCKCAMCEIKGDDKVPPAPTGTFCEKPCFGCTLFTCVSHPDHKPAREAAPLPGGKTYSIMGHICNPEEAATYLRSGELPPWHPGTNIKHQPFSQRLAEYRQREAQAKITPPTAEADTKAYNERNVDYWRFDAMRNRESVKNLESQLKTLAEEVTKLTEDRKRLMEERGLQSAGMYLAGKPLYMLIKDRPVAMDRPASGPGSRPFQPDPKATDRQNMRALMEHVQAGGTYE